MLDDLIIPPWAKWVAAAVGVAGVAAAAYAYGRADGQAIEERKHLAYVAQQSDKKADIMEKDSKTIVKTEIVYRDRIQTIKEKGDVVIKEVPVFVRESDNQQCRINIGFVRAHRASTTGAPAGPAAESDREASGINLDTVAAIDAENNKNHRICREQVIGWQQFYRELQESRARQ